MKSTTQHQFSQVPRAEIPRSSFDRSHGHKTTFDAGLLIPIFLDEALPGDTFNLNMTGFARMATPILPIMDNLFMETFFFAVPMRLLWNNWERFNGAQDNPGDSVDFVIPEFDTTGSTYTYGMLPDYMGLPVDTVQGGPSTGFKHSCLPFRAYWKIWNEWFRDENLQNTVQIPMDDGPDTQADYLIYPARRGKRHDYFTSCLPWPQKGDSVMLPLGDFANITPVGDAKPRFERTTSPGTPEILQVESGGAFVMTSGGPAGALTDLAWNDPQLIVDLSLATSATINQLRQAFQVQKMLERDARGGTRYTEILKAHFGVTSPDFRLQRPEYLGGGSSYIHVNPVAQTSGTAPTDGYTPTPQGHLAAYATASLNGHGFVKSFTEHCIVIGLICVRADLSYQQGLNRMWSRKTRYDFYWPALSHIGEQAVLNKEIFCNADANDDLVFGYQERHAEYRYKPSQITGKFRSSDPQSLDAWHLAQDFAALPTLGAAFIEENPPLDRVLAVPSEPHFLFDSYFQLRCARPMPIFGVPGLIDHF